jgi:predicted molibdopterin-dependent oxidoreductase YjgC
MASGKSSEKINWKSTICGICPAGCWVRAGMKAGRLVKIEAEKGHPLVKKVKHSLNGLPGMKPTKLL